jgi:predicted nuclease of predicted toxin-antitoxin system
VKLLFDENLSPRLVGLLSSEYPDSEHVASLGLQGRADREIWQAARDQGAVLVSKDDDFRQLAAFFGFPPKVVWLRVGNAGTARIADLLRAARDQMQAFVEDEEAALHILLGP